VHRVFDGFRKLLGVDFTSSLQKITRQIDGVRDI
jgi:hypothetical protein